MKLKRKYKWEMRLIHFDMMNLAGIWRKRRVERIKMFDGDQWTANQIKQLKIRNAVSGKSAPGAVSALYGDKAVRPTRGK